MGIESYDKTVEKAVPPENLMESSQFVQILQNRKIWVRTEQILSASVTMARFSEISLRGIRSIATKSHPNACRDGACQLSVAYGHSDTGQTPIWCLAISTAGANTFK
jgi:hypothetical protein